VVKISEAFRKFGISDITKNLLVVKVSVTPEITHDTVARHLDTAIEGHPVPFDDETLSVISDLSKIKKIYKITPPSSGASTQSAKRSLANGTTLDERRYMEKIFLGAIAMRGAG
jgi:EKC/KEOPS complex subunit CGI121/TPRKB